MAISKIQEISIGHVKQLNNLIDNGAIPRLRKVYMQAQTELEQKLSKALGSGASTFTVQKYRSLLAQAHTGLAELGRSLGTAMGAETARVQTISANALISDIKVLSSRSKSDRSSTANAVQQIPIEHAARFTGIIDKRKTSLLKLNKTSMAKYGASIITKLQGALTQSLVQGETGHEAIDRVTKAHDMEWWRAERIVRTEQNWAYNATQADGVEAASKDMPDMMMRWVELVTDVSLQPLDKRVGDDSIAMHGQLAKPGGIFRMPSVAPAGLKISRSLLGKSWENPPNRPNDRAVLQPWRPGWGWGREMLNGIYIVRH